jgi:hypothetical protein
MCQRSWLLRPMAPLSATAAIIEIVIITFLN